jgi:hypothetical protein
MKQHQLPQIPPSFQVLSSAKNSTPITSQRSTGIADMSTPLRTVSPLVNYYDSQKTNDNDRLEQKLDAGLIYQQQQGLIAKEAGMSNITTKGAQRLDNNKPRPDYSTANTDLPCKATMT